MTTFYENYVALCALNKKSPSAVATEIGLSRTSPNGWKKGKMPSDVNLNKLAQYFNVPVSYFSENPEKEKSPTIESGALMGEAKKELIQLCLSLSDSEADMVYKLITVALEGIRNTGNG